MNAATLAEKGVPIPAGGFLIREAGINLYFDPAEAEEGLPKADIVCLSYSEPQQLPLRAVRRLSTPQTIVVGLTPCVAQFRLNQLPVCPGQSRGVLGLTVEVEKGEGGSLRYRVRYPGFFVRYPEPGSGEAP